MDNYGIEDTTIIGCTKGLKNRIEIRRCKGIANVASFYDSGIGRSCYGNGGANQVVFGFYFEGFGYWFKKKSDAVFSANWVADNDWDGEGDLEMFIQGAMCTKENGWKDLGKVHF